MLAPGPTPLPPEVLAAMALPVIHHRTPQFGAVLAEVQKGLRELFGTGQDVLVLAASGTGAMEGSVTNLLSAGDEAVVVNGGKVGERWTKNCHAYGGAVHEVALEWGRAGQPAAGARALPRVGGRRPPPRLLCGGGPRRSPPRHDRLARATRAAAAALGLRLLAPDSPSPAATAIFLPDGLDGSALFRYLRDRIRVTFAGGQDRLKGKIIRIAHLGYVDAFDVVTGVAALELGLRHFGAPVDLGRGVGAAEAVLAEGLPAR